MYITKFGKTFQTKWWKNEKLDPKLIAYDTETTLITSPAIVPDIILSTAYDGSNFVYIIKNSDIANFFEVNHDATLCFWNAAFDTPVIKKAGCNALEHYIDNSKLLDGQILYRLLSIATEGKEAQKWALDSVTEEILKETLDKDDNIRLTFGQYLVDNEVKYDTVSDAHIKYACLDPICTYMCTQQILNQIKLLPTTTNLAHQINLLGDIALAQVTRNGIHIDQERVERIKGELEIEKVRNEEILSTYGYVKGKKGNTKVLEDICKQEGFHMPVTASGRMSTAMNYLKEYKAHPFVNAYLQFKGFSKKQNFLTDLSAPVVYPRYNTIKVTSRSSCTRPNIQNMPRVGGIRECFIPEPGHVFIDVDYSGIELVAIASITKKLFKHSVMADLLNQGVDLHKYAASKIYKIPENEVSKDQRQTAKILNFGLISNMSPTTFVGHAAKFGLILTLEESSFLKKEWTKVFPEMEKYWKRGYGKQTVLTDTGFIRANCSYTEFLNCPMQSRAAEGAKIALYTLVRLGYKVAGFVHDQFLVSVKKEHADVALVDVQQIVIDSMQKLTVGVKVSTSGEICNVFKK